MSGGIRPKGAGSAYCPQCYQRRQPFGTELCDECKKKNFTIFKSAKAEGVGKRDSATACSGTKSDRDSSVAGLKGLGETIVESIPDSPSAAKKEKT